MFVPPPVSTGDRATPASAVSGKGERGVRARVRRFVRREHEPVSLRQALSNGLSQGVVLMAGFVTAFVLSSAFTPEDGIVDMIRTPHGEQGVQVELSDRQADRLVKKHDCWVGEAPAGMAGRVPGHAVVMWPGATVPTYGGSRAVKVGLVHRFEKPVAGFALHGFCP